MREREWDGRCQRCSEKSYSYTMSMYSTALVCGRCWNKEREREDYGKAVEADENEIRKGNFNYKGVGEP